MRAYRYLRGLILASTILVFLVIIAGGILRASAATGACADWPTCFGSWMPPQADRPLLDYAHRLATLLAAPVVLLATLFGRHYRAAKRLQMMLNFSGLMVGLQTFLGAWIALEINLTSNGFISSLHLLFALATLAALTGATVIVFKVKQDEISNASIGEFSLSFLSPYGRLSLAAGVVFLALMFSGSLVSDSGLAATCTGWPLCTPSPNQPLSWLVLVHRLIVGLAGIILLASFIQAWRTQRSQVTVLVAATATFVLFVAQALLGAKLVVDHPTYLVVLHSATAAAAWAALVVQVMAVGLAGRHAVDEAAESVELGGRRGMWRDLLMLTKPIVVALLLVTTFAGMVIGARAWPDWQVVFWTLLAGFMAAGGSGAINQYIDRGDDGKMQRTQKRPIPSGRLTPAEGLAFGVALTLGAFYLMTAMVNFLAALLTLAGAIYYVLIYSIFLKKTTVQNIVIGGGAGAIPPLVGWAAATGSLNIPSLFLFAVVFMWTPPHFWALALVRSKDYARAGVPMLPVVRGEGETRWQIFLYTIELVALTLLLPLFGLGGSVYLVGAGLLGVWLLAAAWKVWKQGGNKLAWKMYRYSSMYLAFLFVVLMVDRLL